MAAAVKHAKIMGTSPRSDTKQLQVPGTDGKSSSHSDRRQSTFKPTDQPQGPPAEDMKRRRSTFRGVASNFMFLRRMTKASMDKEAIAAAAAAAAKPKVRMENTYQVGPKEEQHFHYSKAERAIHEVLESVLANQSYHASKASMLVSMLSERVKAAVKGLHCERYKLVTNVILGPVSNQGMVVASRCMWDTATDTSSTVNYNNGKIFAIVNVYAVYFE